MRTGRHVLVLVLASTLVRHTAHANVRESEFPTSPSVNGSIQVPPRDVSGRWSGTLTLRSSSGTVQTQPLYLILSQQGSALTGSPGADERTQSAIRNGRVIADEFVFQVGAVSVRLHFNGALLEGVGSRADDARVTATITVTRVSDNTLEDRLPLLLYEGSDRSPRMLALREAVQTGGSAVVEDFWKAVTASGAPLVEPISGND